MSKKIVFSKPFNYKHDARDDVQQSHHISYYGMGMFRDMDYIMYDDGTTARTGLNKRKISCFSNRRNLNHMKRRMTR